MDFPKYIKWCWINPTFPLDDIASYVSCKLIPKGIIFHHAIISVNYFSRQVKTISNKLLHGVFQGKTHLVALATDAKGNKKVVANSTFYILCTS